MTGMNWFWLVIGIGSGALGQRWLSLRQQRLARSTQLPVTPSAVRKSSSMELPQTEETGQSASATVSAPSGSIPVVESCSGDDEKLLWISYVRALERAQFQGGFLARVAHELRSPLSSLMGLQQLILADLCDDAEEERQCVAQSYEAAQNLHSLMDQLIRVAKLEQGSQQLDIQPIALDLLLEDVESFVQLQVADRNARLHLQLPAQSVYAKADYNSLRQVLVMLVEVALSQKACEIRLTLAPGSDGVMLNFWTDQPMIPLQEPTTKLQDDGAGLWDQENLIQLKQSLRQEPGSGFVPHRLAPGMVLLISQLLLDLNRGKLTLTPVSGEAMSKSSPDEAAVGETDSGLDQGYALEVWLPST